MIDFIAEFHDFLNSNGMAPDSGTKIIADDKIHRFSTADRIKKSDCSYQLNIVDDFAYGWVRNFYQGVRIDFSSRSKRKMTADERAMFQSQMKASKAKADLERKVDQEKARRKAEDIWSRSKEDAPKTEYEIRKGIARHGMRVFMGKFLVVPVLNESDDIVGVQMIAPDGSKKFNANSEKLGFWFRIGDEPNRGDEVMVCEGVSTGDAIHKATGKTVYVAFDAGNLLYVSKKLSKKYEIIVCADNDQARVIKGKPENIGLLRAQEAAEAVGGRVCAPPDTGVEQPVRSRDFNDLLLEEGIEACKKALMISQTSVQIHEEPEDESWRDEIVFSKNGGMVANSLINLELFMDNISELKGVFAYDQFSLRVIVKRCPPWENSSLFTVHDLCGNDLTGFLIWCEHHGLKPSKDTAWDMIVRSANNNSFHPARDYFNTLVWDGIQRLDRVLIDIYQCTDDEDYLKFIFRKWMAGAVARVYDPGCKFDNMLILEGDQYLGKSKSLKQLCTFNGISYFADNIKDIHNKDTLMTMQGKLIIEFAELSAWRKAESNDLKAFMTREVDMYRPPYERSIMNVPRQCVFAGTTNPSGAYFMDVTGNRRFWPVFCKRIDHYILGQLKEQLWAEAIHIYKSGEQLWLTDEEYKIASNAQKKRMQEDAWIEDIQSMADDREDESNPFLSNEEIYQQLGIEKNRKDEYTLKRIQRVMTSLNWVEGRGVIMGKKLRGWRPKK